MGPAWPDFNTVKLRPSETIKYLLKEHLLSPSLTQGEHMGTQENKMAIIYNQPLYSKDIYN